VEMNNLTEQV